MEQVKLFLSHASEDQRDFVRPLAEALTNEFKVWYSEYELTIGDRLLAKIDEGLRTCDYGIVVLSPHFFAKRWPREELEGLFQLETTERKVILPIWKDISEAEVRRFSPILAGRLGADSNSGIPKIVADIRKAVGLVDRYKEISSSAWKEKIKKLDADLGHKKRSEAFSHTREAVELASKTVLQLIDQAWKMAEDLTKNLSTIQLRLSDKTKVRDPHSFELIGPNRLVLLIYYSNHIINSIDEAKLSITVLRARDNWDENSKVKTFDKYELRPKLDKDMKIFWSNANVSFSSHENLLDFAFERFITALQNDSSSRH